MRDGFCCVYCRKTASSAPLQLDHYKRVQDGGTNKASNLVTVCRKCNSAKGQLTIRQWFKKLRAVDPRIDTREVGRRCRRQMRKDITPYRQAAKALIRGECPNGHP